MTIPFEVGEIDFLEYDAKQHLLVLAEATIVSTCVEARYWRDDVATLVGRKGSHAAKFWRKIDWASTQRHE